MLIPLILAAMGIVLNGCVVSGTGSNFRTALERYVAEEGNGDLNILRETTGERVGVQPQFGAIDGDTESQGLLLGFREVGGRAWYVYLVGVTKERDIRDIRLLAVTDSLAGGTNLLWSESGPDNLATSRYRSARLAAWRKNQSEARSDKHFKITFPAPDDVFRLDVAGNTASATDEKSGARWTLLFAEAAASRPAR